ncbi:MAG: hypothetical protein IPN74_18025 [Haliscomenobacter sp.]|nr:hypothetical protein [Haliscomenobacter sp.]
MILLDKTGSLPSISLQAGKGQYAGRIEISWNSAPGYLYQLGKWQNARWEMLTAPGEDTLFVDEAGGIPNGDTIWYALFLLKDSLSTPQRAGEDFGFASGNIPAPAIQDVLLSLEEPFIQLFWDEPGLQVRVFRGSPDRPDALYPISDWLEGESDYTDLNVRKGGEYLYAIRTRQESRISDWSPFSLVNVPGDFSSLCDGAVSLECGFRGVFGSGENHVANLPGINAALGNKDLVLFFPGVVVYRSGYEVRISSSSDAFTAYAFRDCSGEENFAVFKIRQGEDLFLSEISREPFYLLLESAGSEFDFGFDFEINVDVKCSSGFEIQPVLPCENVHRIRFPIQRGSTYSGSPAIDVLPCYPGPFPGKEIVYAYRQDIFFSQDTLTIRLICAESWKDSVDLFLVADCSGEDTCSLLSSKMEVIGGSLIIEKRYIVDPFEEVFIIIDSRPENPILYELHVGLPYDNGRSEFWESSTKK